VNSYILIFENYDEQFNVIAVSDQHYDEAFAFFGHGSLYFRQSYKLKIGDNCEYFYVSNVSTYLH